MQKELLTIDTTHRCMGKKQGKQVEAVGTLGKVSYWREEGNVYKERVKRRNWRRIRLRGGEGGGGGGAVAVLGFCVWGANEDQAPKAQNCDCRMQEAPHD